MFKKYNFSENLNLETIIKTFFRLRVQICLFSVNKVIIFVIIIIVPMPYFCYDNFKLKIFTI